VAAATHGHRFALTSTMNPLHILLLERNDSDEPGLLDTLRGAGHRVVTALNTEHVAKALAGGEFDTLVLDLTWPELDIVSLRRALFAGSDPEPDSLEAAERRHLALVLRHTSGNKRKAALLLGISRSTLLNKVRKYGLEGSLLSRHHDASGPEP
jgi:sigma-54 dependent transcriptional regulator, acetoin dehydrogenase operon transcriptional activator AcoR